VLRRRAWLNASVAEVAALRRAGVPLVGYTWWPMFALVTWAYRQGSRPIAAHLAQMGLWDLDGNLNRVPTPLVEAYRHLVHRAAGSQTPSEGLLARARGEFDVPQLLSCRI